LDALVGELRQSRRAAARKLEQGVHEQLGALAMGEATFEVALSQAPARPSGGDEAQFTIAPNPGVAAAPLREIASGGELSRIMLALASVVSTAGAHDTGASTLVFDEIDAGIGGHTARAVGERLREVAQGRQVLCITHLPQIASLAQRHFSVVKRSETGATRTSVVELAEGQVLSELVRMLGADERDTGARKHARELLRAA
jgi:DNA repair protein RecN (Recombination protein N)